jgi:ABC-type polysaccharide/polyol phosphate transport system ATPase subunit
VLIVDEILSVGDGGFREKCLDRIRQFRDSGKTILMVSHDMDIMSSFCSRLLLVHQGRLIEDGEPSSVVRTYQELLTSRQAAMAY